MDARVGTGGIYVLLQPDLAPSEAEAEEDVAIAVQERRRVERVARDRRRAGDAGDGLDVAAGQGRSLDRSAEVALPGDAAVPGVEGIDRVVLGCDVDAVADGKRLGVDLPVELLRPG